MQKSTKLVGSIFFMCALFYSCNVDSCTGITLKSEDGSFVYGRTLEFPEDLESNLIVVPRGYTYTGSTPSGKNGLTWDVKYAFVGMNASAEPTMVADGLNEKGLAVGSFFFPGYAKFQTYEEKFAKKTLSPIEFPIWLLSNFATTDQVKKGINSCRIVNVVLKQWGFVPPLHFFVIDKQGNSIVLEYMNDEVKIHDNPIGVITNSPEFDWHITNLNNFVNMSRFGAPPQKLGDLTLKPFGGGSGMLGLPGDFTPPSRFVRAAFFSQNAFVGKDAIATVKQVFHILNSFDIPEGVSCKSKELKNSCGKTDWTSACDTNNLRYYVHTINNRAIRMVDLKKAKLDAKDIVTIPVFSVEEKIEDLTPKG